MGDRRELADPTELSAYIRVPVTTLYQWHHRGVGPPVLKIGRHLRYRWSDIDKWLDAQNSEAAA